MQGPLVSVVVRTKDRPALLLEALRSVASQIYRPVEAVVVNDGGEGLDAGALEKALGGVPLRHVRFEKNRGRAEAANAGVENSTGDFVWFLDDDDLIYPEGVRALVSASIEADAPVLYGKCNCVKYHEGGREQMFVFDRPFDPDELLFGNYIPINALLIKKDCIREVGGFDPRFEIFEDWDLLFRLSRIYDFLFVEGVVSEYRVFGSATITMKGGAGYQGRMRDVFYGKHCSHLSSKALDSYVEKRKAETAAPLHERIRELEAELSDIRGSRAWKAIGMWRKLKGRLGI